MIVPLFSAKPTRIGVDISSTAVKIIQLEKHRGGYRTAAFSTEPLPPGAVQGKSITDTDAVAAALTRATQRARLKGKRLCMAVPTSSAVSRVLHIDNPGNEFELEEQVRAEAAQYIPFPIDEVNFDFEKLESDILGKQKKRRSGQEVGIDVLMAATRTDNVDSRVAVAEAAGMAVDVIDIESFALQNAYTEILAPTLTPEERSQPVAVFDLGDTTTTLNIFVDDDIVYTREHEGGGQQLTADIAAQYGLSLDEADQRKRDDSLPEDYERKVLQPYLDALAMNVERFIQYYYSESSGNTVNLILLGGGAANTHGATERINNETGVTTRLANPFAALAKGPGVSTEQVARHGTAMLIACGLALRSFD
ncbi:MAG: type IV pilus assembly protein PilM [Guyparkeria sp.]|uniref:type IV pilus assembly protein PilM n=1 Tax=Guyparkeria sp. TaxID=2035736 RepID=UPI0039796600